MTDADGFYRPHGIDPHQGREAELLLAGTKPFAVFWPPERVPKALIEAARVRRVAHVRHAVKRARPQARAPQESATQERAPPERAPRARRRQSTIEVNFFAPIDHDEDQFRELQSLVLDVLSGRRRIDAATDKRLGQVLGYSDSDIKSFLVWKAQLKKSLF